MQNENVKKFKEYCDNIIKLNPKIRYVGIISPYGRTLAGKLREGVIPLLKSDEAINEFFITAIREMLRREFEKSLGKHEVTISLYEKVNSLVIANSYIVYITFDKDTSINEMLDVAKKAKNTIS